MIITLKGADFSANNIGTLTTWNIFTSIGSGATYDGVNTVDRGAAFSATVTLTENYEVGPAGVTVTMGGIDVTSTAVTTSGSTITISIASVTGTVYISVPTKNTATGEEEEPETPVNYTFTINPTPANATVTLTASGYTQNGNSITVPNGTTVSWSVSADGYTEQNGTWTANGSNETLPVTLNEESGGDVQDISAYIQEGKAIIKAGELSDNAAFFAVVNYPVKGATYYLIPYARNAYCLTATGGTSGGMLTGSGSPTATLRAAGTAATMSICFKYDDIDPSDVTITETVAPTT